MIKKRPLWERVEEKINKNHPSGCWLWTASLDGKGYGQIQIGTHKNQKLGRSHRIVYEFYKGVIPAGLDLDHLCRVRHCVNPDHLEHTTRKENLRRGNGAQKSRERMLARTQCRNGHVYETGSFKIVKCKGRSTSRLCIACLNNRTKKYKTK